MMNAIEKQFQDVAHQLQALNIPFEASLRIHRAHLGFVVNQTTFEMEAFCREPAIGLVEYGQIRWLVDSKEVRKWRIEGMAIAIDLDITEYPLGLTPSASRRSGSKSRSRP